MMRLLAIALTLFAVPASPYRQCEPVKPMYWVHVHNCGGTTIRRLAQRYGEVALEPASLNWNLWLEVPLDPAPRGAYAAVTCRDKAALFASQPAATWTAAERSVDVADLDCGDAFDYGLTLRSPAELMLSTIVNNGVDVGALMRLLRTREGESIAGVRVPHEKPYLEAGAELAHFDNFLVRTLNGRAVTRDVGLGRLNETHLAAAIANLERFAVVLVIEGDGALDAGALRANRRWPPGAIDDVRENAHPADAKDAALRSGFVPVAGRDCAKGAGGEACRLGKAFDRADFVGLRRETLEARSALDRRLLDAARRLAAGRTAPPPGACARRWTTPLEAYAASRGAVSFPTVDRATPPWAPRRAPPAPVEGRVLHVVTTALSLGDERPRLVDARLRLFLALAAPSMARQTTTNFVWCVYARVDRWPRRAAERLRAALAPHAHFALLESLPDETSLRPRDFPAARHLAAAGVDASALAGGLHLRTALDCDSALPPEFIATLQELALNELAAEKPSLVACARSLVEWSPYGGGAAGVADRRPNAAHCLGPGFTVAARGGDERTGVRDVHTNPKKADAVRWRGPVVFVDGPPPAVAATLASPRRFKPPRRDAVPAVAALRALGYLATPADRIRLERAADFHRSPASVRSFVAELLAACAPPCARETLLDHFARLLKEPYG